MVYNKMGNTSFLGNLCTWAPCTQEKDYENFPPITVTSARGCHIYTNDGRKIIDAISSWWCKSLGHQHPIIKAALAKQLEKFEHIIPAGTSNDATEQLSQLLSSLTPNLNKVFYASDGACAVEIAMKMSLHLRNIQGEFQRKKFIVLKNCYHGETLGALSLNNLEHFRAPYNAVLFNPHVIDVPYVNNTQDPLWNNADFFWHKIKNKLINYAKTSTAIVIEPLLQGAAGMKLYSQDFLKKLGCWARTEKIHIIADEITTGIGRTGKMLAIEHADIQADFICLGKGLTSGFLPLSAVITSEEIYKNFYDSYEKGKTFFHSHVQSGNALAASTATATIQLIQQENLCERALQLQSIMMKHLQEVAEKTGCLKNLRGIGAVVAADLISTKPRIGFSVYQEALKRGALLRPLGDTLYWLPPLIIDDQTLAELAQITIEAIKTSAR